MRSMTRWTLAGCMALAAVSAVAVLDVGYSTAEAAPSISRFAGTYVPADASSPWSFAISDGGRITGSYSLGSGGGEFSKGSLSGRVGADGSFSFTVSESGAYYLDPERFRLLQRWKSSYVLVGNMTLDPDGNVVGTSNSGGSFVWLRQ